MGDKIKITWIHWLCPYCSTENWDSPELTSMPMCAGEPNCPDPYDFEWEVVFDNEINREVENG